MWINIGVFVAALPCLFFLIRLVPEQPKEHDDVVEADGIKPAVPVASGALVA